MTAENSSHFPYQACLIPNLPGEIQHQVRDITDHVVRPLGMFLAVMSFICNSLVLITVTRTKSLQKAAFLILCSLSITDLIYSVHSLIRDIETLAHEHMCLNQFSPERRSVAALCNLATLGNLAVISRDRYLAVRKPMWYRSHVTKSRAIKTTCVPWLISLVIAFVVYLSRKLEGGYKVLGQIISLSSVLFCFFVIIFCYVSIYCKPTLQQFLHMRAIVEREKRMANTVGLILLVLLLTFLPALLFPLVLYVKGVKYFQPYVPFYSFLLLLNGILNPLLNFGRNKDMRKALRDLFKCSQQVQPSASTSASQQQQQQQQLRNRSTTT